MRPGRHISGTDSVRAFIAVKLPENIIARIRRLQEDLSGCGLGIRWVRPRQIHLTLRFLGDILPADLEKVRSALDAAVTPLAPFSLCAKSLGAFPRAGSPRVIWTGIGGGLPALMTMQRSIEDRLADIGWMREKRAFRAHLTLGRTKKALDPLSLKAVFEVYGRFESETFAVERVFLLKSDLLPSGAVYSVLASSPLSGG